MPADFLHHPLAKLFPAMPAQEFALLKQDIAKHGVHAPVVLLDRQILDGRHRHRAALELGMDCPTVEFDGEDPVAFVWSANGLRRHLSESQLAMVAAGMAEYRQGRPRKPAPVPVFEGRAEKPAPVPVFEGTTEQQAPGPIYSQADAAKAVGVSERSVRSARKVIENGAPEVIEAVTEGKLPVKTAERIARLPKEEQVAAIDAPPKAKAKPNEVEALRAENASLRAQLEEARERIEELELDLQANLGAGDEEVRAQLRAEYEMVRRRIANVEVERDTIQAKCNSLIREVRALRRRLGQEA